MAFLTKSDIQKAIKADMLAALLDSDDTVVTAAIDEAVAKVQNYLSGRYDMKIELAKTGTNRHQLLVVYTGDIAIYNIWRYVDPMQIPARRVAAYDEAMEWLKAAMAGEASTTLTPESDGETSGGTLYFNSNDKRINQY